MTGLIAAAFLFLAIHVLSSSSLRGWLVARLGENLFRGLFSLLSLAAIYWLIQAYNSAPLLAPFWLFGLWARLLALALVLCAFLLVVCGLTVLNPSAAGFEKGLQAAEPARGILRVTRHPFLWGVGIWALAHLLNNGDPASVVFFGTFAVLAFCGTLLVDRKKRAAYGTDWQRFQDFTSNLPFAAIAAGRNHLSLAEIGWWRLLLAVVLYAGVLHAHSMMFGVTPLP